jgi:hypothetical protein
VPAAAKRCHVKAQPERASWLGINASGSHVDRPSLIIEEPKRSPPAMDCATCGKTAKELRRLALARECSRVECPSRRSVMALDGYEPMETRRFARRTERKLVVDVGND